MSPFWALTGWRLLDTPAGFIPDQDQGFLIGVIQLPPGSSLDRTEAVMTRASEIIKGTDGVEGMVAFAGLDGSSFSFGSQRRDHLHPAGRLSERKSPNRRRRPWPAPSPARPWASRTPTSSSSPRRRSRVWATATASR
jgi:multidrug efflux pump subunit AcrB